METLGYTPPVYTHVPMLVDEEGTACPSASTASLSAPCGTGALRQKTSYPTWPTPAAWCRNGAVTAEMNSSGAAISTNCRTEPIVVNML